MKTIEKLWLDFRADLQKRIGASAVPEAVWLTIRMAYFAGAGAAIFCVCDTGQTLAEEVHQQIESSAEDFAALQKKASA